MSKKKFNYGQVITELSYEALAVAGNGRDFSRFNGLNPLIKEVPKGIPTDKIPTDKRKPEGISFIGRQLALVAGFETQNCLTKKNKI